MTEEKCKNCHEIIAETDKFCKQCGAKIIRHRITFKTLIAEAFWRSIGWDSKYFKTIRELIITPEKVFGGYINGVRKRYVNPIAFFAIGMTITLITFNVFQDHFMELSGVVNVNMEEDFDIPDDSIYAYEQKDLSDEDIERIKDEMRINAMIQHSILKYYNVYSFVLLPVYALVGFLVFGRKRNNYTEQLVINAYIQGLSFLNTTLLFIISLFTFSSLANYAILFLVFYSAYAYGRLYGLSFGKNVLFFLKFIGVATAISLVLLILVVIIVTIVYPIPGK